jgi:predicted transcriptional regulator
VRLRGLLTLLTFSKRREELLLLLYGGSKTLAEIRKHLGASSAEVLHRIKELEEANLVCREDNCYTLSPVGGVVARFLQPLVNTLHVIEEHEEFWREHAVDAIPPQFFERIGDLGNCRLIEHGIENLHEPHKEFFENIRKSKNVKGLSPIFNPAYPAFFSQLAQKEVSVSLILTQRVFEKVKKGHTGEIQRFLDYDNTSLHVLKDDVRLAFVVTDVFLSLSLFFKNGSFDSQRDLISFDASARKWGEELFNYYRENAVEIKSL